MSFFCPEIERFYLLVTRLGHFQRGRQICPQLKAMHPAGVVTLWHFLVNDSAAGRHPLHVTG
jgi:hypothetical protein